MPILPSASESLLYSSPVTYPHITDRHKPCFLVQGSKDNPMLEPLLPDSSLASTTQNISIIHALPIQKKSKIIYIPSNEHFEHTSNLYPPQRLVLTLAKCCSLDRIRTKWDFCHVLRWTFPPWSMLIVNLLLQGLFQCYPITQILLGFFFLCMMKYIERHTHISRNVTKDENMTALRFWIFFSSSPAKKFTGCSIRWTIFAESCHCQFQLMNSPLSISSLRANIGWSQYALLLVSWVKNSLELHACPCVWSCPNNWMNSLWNHL